MRGQSIGKIEHPPKSRRSSRTRMSSARKPPKTSSTSSSTTTTTTLSQPKYSFPILSVKEILLCLHELEMDVKPEELMNCGKYRSKIRSIVEGLMEICLGVSREEVSLKVMNSLEEEHNPVVEVCLFRQAQAMMLQCGVHDYNLEDWLAPEPKRLRRNLSAIINFAKFREEELIAYTEMCQRRDIKFNELQEAKEELKQLEKRANELEDSTAHHRFEAQQAEQDAISLQAQIDDLVHASRQAELCRQRFESKQAMAANQCRRLEEAALSKHHSVDKDQNNVKNTPVEQLLQQNHLLAIQAKKEREEAHKTEAAVLAAESALRQIQALVPQVTDALAMLDTIETNLAQHKNALTDLKHVNSETKRLTLSLQDTKIAAQNARTSAQASERRMHSAQQDTQKLKHNFLLSALHQDLAALHSSLEQIQSQFKHYDDANQALHHSEILHQQQIAAQHDDITKAANELTKHLNDTMLLLKNSSTTNNLNFFRQAATDDYRQISSLALKQAETSPPLPPSKNPLVPITNMILPQPRTPPRSSTTSMKNQGGVDDNDTFALSAAV